MDRLLQSVTGAIRLEIRNQAGDLANADAPPAVSVKDGASTTVASGASTLVSTGIYEFILTPTQTAVLDRYTASWSAAFSGVTNTFATHFEVVGGFIFGVGEVRALNAELANTTTYPTAKLVDAREGVSDDLETECGIAFAPRGRRVTLSGDDRKSLLIPNLRVRRLVSLKVGGTAFTQAELDDLAVEPWGLVTRKTLGTYTDGDRNVEVHYEHGYDFPPEGIRRAALVLAKHRLLPSPMGLDARSSSVTTDEGTYTLIQPGIRRPFGIPEVDAEVERYREEVPVFG